MEFFEVMFRALTGMKLTGSTLMFLLVVFALGWLYGKLTLRIGFIKGFFALVFGLVVYAFLAVSNWLIILIFVAGVLVNHGPFVYGILLWAQSLGDIVYAMRYQQAFEDIRQKEDDLEEELRQRRDEAYRQREADSEAQKRWKDETQQARGGKKRQERTAGSSGPKSTGADQKRGSQRQKHEAPKRPTPPGKGLRAQYLGVLGLEPSRDYSPEDIKKAYRRKAKETHPDGGGTAATFIEVQNAYEWSNGSRKSPRG